MIPGAAVVGVAEDSDAVLFGLGEVNGGGGGGHYSGVTEIAGKDVEAEAFRELGRVGEIRRGIAMFRREDCEFRFSSILRRGGHGWNGGERDDGGCGYSGQSKRA